MNQNHSDSRIGEVWGRLIGCFGGDTVERKYGKTVPPEWVSMIARLSPIQIDRGLRRLVYSGRAHLPTLPEFVKLCRSVGGDEYEEPSAPITALPSPDGEYDEWATAGNRHLWNYVFAQMNRRVFDEAATRVLVAFKNAWVRDMREGNPDPATGEITFCTPDEQKAAWKDCMQLAEKAILTKAAA